MDHHYFRICSYIENSIGLKRVSPLYTETPKMGILANSEDPDEMLHNAAFHQGLDCLQRLKQTSGRKMHHNLEFFYLRPLKVHNGQSQIYYLNMYGKIHQNAKG